MTYVQLATKQSIRRKSYENLYSPYDVRST